MSAPPELLATLAASGLQVQGACTTLRAIGATLQQRAALLEDFSLDELDVLGAAMWKISAAPGQVLIAEGQLGDWLLLILHGTVDVTKHIAQQGEAAPRASTPRSAENASSRLAVVKAGATLGEMSLLDGELRYATCTAIEAVEAAVLTRAAIASLIREHPGIGAKLLVKLTQLLAQRLRNTSNQLVKAVSASKAA